MTSNVTALKDLIPLYIKGSVQGEDRLAFEKLLQEDTEFKQEFEEFVEIEQAFVDMEVSKQIEFDNVLARAQAGIRNDLTNQKSESRKSQAEVRLIDRLLGLFTLPQLAWGVALAQFVFIAVLVSVNIEQRDVILTTLSGTQSSAGQIQNILVVFDDDAKLSDIRTLLARVNAKIVDGPSKIGVVKIVVTDKSADLDQIIKQLRISSIVTFADKSL